MEKSRNFCKEKGYYNHLICKNIFKIMKIFELAKNLTK